MRVKLNKNYWALADEEKDRVTEEKPQTIDEATESESQTTKQKAVAKTLLAKLTEEQTKIDGWIYLGKENSKSEEILSSDKRITSKQIPLPDTEVETTTFANLRKSAPKEGELKDIKGILPQKSKLKVKQVEKVPINSDEIAVWAKVTKD